MNLISSIIAFAKSDAEQKGIPVLINFLTNLKSAQNGAQRVAAILSFETQAFQTGLTIGQDVLNDAASSAIAELQSISTGSSSTSTSAPAAASGGSAS